MKLLKLLAGTAAVAAGAVALYTGRTRRRVEAAVPVDGRLVDVDGNRIHVHERGSGPPLLLIHGLGGQMRNFASAMVEGLARDHRVVLIDRPGSGHSRRARGASAALTEQARTVAELIDLLGLERPMVVGHSLGGALALRLAVNHPESVGSLALIAPLTQYQEEVPDVFKALVIESPVVRRMVAHTLAVPLAAVSQEKVFREVFAPEPVPDAFGVEGGGLLGLRPESFYETSSDLVALRDEIPDLVGRYGELDLPVSILYGEGDNVLDPQRHGAATSLQIKGAHLEMVPGGHMLPFTQPERTEQWVRESKMRAQGARTPERK